MNPSFESYRIPTSGDLPQDVRIFFVEEPHPEGPYGAKGLAEPATAPTAAAIANALFNATGIRIREVPLTPEKVEAALEKMEGESVDRSGSDS
jgi:CO/xanthine dehydrogenase Mo-binding subunit